MAEYTSIEELPGYIQAKTEATIALRDAADDENKRLQAQLAWEQKQRELDKQLAQNNDNHRRLEDMRVKVKAQFPDVPESIWAAEADPTTMEQRAKEFSDALKAQVAAANPTTPPVGDTTGMPPTGVGGDSKPSVDWAQRQEELAGKIRAGTAKRSEVEEFQNIQVNMVIRPAQEKAKHEAAGSRR